MDGRTEPGIAADHTTASIPARASAGGPAQAIPVSPAPVSLRNDLARAMGAPWIRLTVDLLFFLGIAGLLLIYNVAGLAEGRSSFWAVLAALSSAVSLGLVFIRRERPWLFLGSLVVTGGLLTWVSSLPALAFLLGAGLFVLEAYGPTGRVRQATTIGLAVLIVAGAGYQTLEAGAFAAVLLVSLLGWARGVRSQRQYRASLIDRLEAAERERDLRAEQAVIAERNRIARDIHDLVSHSLAVVAVQAAGAERIADKDPDRAREALAVIAQTSRDALGEMRALLDVLRDPAVASSEPSPGLHELTALADNMTTRGIPVRFTSTGQPCALGPGPQLALYRTAQEALTNVAKHGVPEKGADLVLRYLPEAVELEVSNAVPATRNDEQAVDETGQVIPGSGIGQAGIRERLALYGGTLTTTGSVDSYRLLVRMPRADAAAFDQKGST